MHLTPCCPPKHLPCNLPDTQQSITSSTTLTLPCPQHRTINSVPSTITTPLEVASPYTAKANPVPHPILVQLLHTAKADDWSKIDCLFDHNHGEVRYTNTIQLTGISPPTIMSPSKSLVLPLPSHPTLMLDMLHLMWPTLSCMPLQASKPYFSTNSIFCKKLMSWQKQPPPLPQ